MPKKKTDDVAALSDDAIRFLILELLTHSPGLDSQEVADQLGLSYKLSSDLCADLRRRGLLQPA